MAEVLVVEDDAAVRALVRTALEDAGFSVVEAPDGPSAVAALHGRHPDVVLLDVALPGLDGFGVLRALRQQGLARGARVVMLTGRVAEHDHLRAWELGCDEYLTKPVDPLRLVRRLRGLLATSPEELAARRAEELQKAELLDRLEAAFARTRPVRAV